MHYTHSPQDLTNPSSFIALYRKMESFGTALKFDQDIIYVSNMLYFSGVLGYEVYIDENGDAEGNYCRLTLG